MTPTSNAQMELIPSSKPKPLTLYVKGIIPSFKTQKRVFAWINKQDPSRPETWKAMGRPLIDPEHKKWMQATVQSFVSQLRFALQITGSTTLTDATLRSLIASSPHDDCWTALPETVLKSELCEPGQEGAIIVIERI